MQGVGARNPRQGKKLVLLLNKIDLVPHHAVEAWKTRFQRSFPTLAFKCARGGTQRVTHAATSASRAPEGLLRSSHAVVGADELMQLIKNYARTGGGQEKARVSVGIVGYPNTGKSSLINSMKRHPSVMVGGRAGVTKVMQEVQLDKKVTLIDCPGVVFAGNSNDPALILRNVVRVENVADPYSVVEALIQKTPRESLIKFYGFDFSSTSDFLQNVARVRGKLQRGRGLDIPQAAKSVITDWTDGKFRYYVLPAETAANNAVGVTAEVVTTLAPALDIASLLSGRGAAPLVLGAPSGQRGSPEDVEMAAAEDSLNVDL